MARYPAIVKEYIPASHSARVDILGFTEGDSAYPEAEIEYSIGDKYNHTEILVKPGDFVWVDFINNDIRYPIITGYRNPQTGCATGWRKFEHENIEMAAGSNMVLSGSKLIINFSEIQIAGVTQFSNEVTTNSPLHTPAGIDNGAGGAVAVSGGIAVSSGDIVADEISLKEHIHRGDSGGDTSQPK